MGSTIPRARIPATKLAGERAPYVALDADGFSPSRQALIRANFDANRIVDRQFAQDPARGVAMTVFGDPLLSLT